MATTTMIVGDSTGESSKTVRFDVGGQIYKVSRSMIELYSDTMLARMVDAKWQRHKAAGSTSSSLKQGDDDTLFIDRNGDRFQYVLDYMRDRQVSLPMTVSVSAFRQDLEYYGFDNAKELSILVGTPAEASPLFATLIGNFHDDLDEFDVLIKEAEKRKDKLKQQKSSLKMAHEVFGRSASMQGNGPHTIRLESDDARSCANSALGSSCDSRYLKEYLANYGLGLVSVTWKYYNDPYSVVVKRCACNDDGSSKKPSCIWAQPDHKNVEPENIPLSIVEPEIHT